MDDTLQLLWLSFFFLGIGIHNRSLFVFDRAGNTLIYFASRTGQESSLLRVRVGQWRSGSVQDRYFQERGIAVFVG
jgi:hypothetical protein